MSQESTLANLGESESLRRTIGRLIQGEYTLVGPGDDAAVVRAPDSRYVVTTDTMIEVHDFRLDWSTGFDLGFKAIASNVADVAAMGAKPTALVVAIALPGTTDISWLEAFADGLNAAITELAPGAEVVGGDIARSEQVFISVTAHGDLEGREPVLRSGAKPGDVLAVAGTLGRAAAGLSILQSGIADVISAFDDLVGIQLRPQPPISAGVSASLAGATSMLDISDGLARDAHRIAKASGVSIEINGKDLQGFEATLEQAAMRLGVHSSDWVRFGGEDHSLLATFPADAVIPREFKPIGQVVTQTDNLVTLDGIELQQNGWDSIRG
ncbi:MAG: thiamine-phosphate kinase [Rhodoluna sp.]|nr:thiamine-phosphate kinase [Rhodoluna sp.]